METKATRPAGRSRVARGLRVSAVVLVLLLVALEVGLRVVRPGREAPPLRFVFANRFDADIDEHSSVFRASPTVFWEPRPGAAVHWTGGRINSHGLHGPEYPREAAPDELRVAVLGDSCTFGAGAEAGEDYGTGLAQRLTEALPGRRVRCLNGGVPGYTVFQGARFFEETVLPLGPDLAVLYYGVWNDFNPAMGATDRELFERGGRPTSTMERIYGLARHSQLVEVLARRYAGTVRYRHRKEIVDTWMQGEPPGGYRVDLEQYRLSLNRLLDRLEELDIPAVLVLPELNHHYTRGQEQPIQFERLDRYREATRAIAEQRGLSVVDQRTLIDPRDQDPFFSGLVHPNATGYALLAQALAERILTDGLFEGR